MFWILAAPSLLAVLIAVPLLPYGTAGAALRRSHGAEAPPGSFRWELRRAGLLLRRTLLRPLLWLAVVQVVLALHHTSFGVGHVLAEVFGDFHPETSLNAVDFEAWEAAYAESRLAGGPPPPLARLLVSHWPLYPAYLALAGAYLAVHFLRAFPRAVQAYVRGVERRAYRHAVQEREAAGAEPQRATVTRRSAVNPSPAARTT